MTAFLSWVYAQASKVYDWFGDAYYSAKNAVSNAYNWAVQQANVALNAARTYAYNLLQQAQGGINSAISWLQSQVAIIRQGVYEDITNLSDWVEWKLSQVGNFASDVFWSAIDDARSFAASIQNSIYSLIDNVSNALYDYVSNNFGWVLSLRDDLLRLLNVFSPTMVQSIISFFTTGINTVLSFISNPLEFILDIITPKFISFLCYVLAWSLGATNSDLPGNQTWKG